MLKEKKKLELYQRKLNFAKSLNVSRSEIKEIPQEQRSAPFETHSQSNIELLLEREETSYETTMKMVNNLSSLMTNFSIKVEEQKTLSEQSHSLKSC